MNYYNTIAAIIPWKQCLINGCDSTNYNGWHIHNHARIGHYQVWTLDHISYRKGLNSLEFILETIDKGTI